MKTQAATGDRPEVIAEVDLQRHERFEDELIMSLERATSSSPRLLDRCPERRSALARQRDCGRCGCSSCS